ncbi:MAG: peptidylprolyl isomerase [Lacipirellulaceae bacterium]
MRKIALLFICLTLFVSTATAQTVRFDTNVGSFNINLNPSNNPDLQDHVDNFLGYVALGRYHFSAINRDDDIDTDRDMQDDSDFALQMGGLSAFPASTAAFAQLFQSIETNPPVLVDDDLLMSEAEGLSNSRGTVSLALSPFPNTRTTNPDSGTNSFFINLIDNNGDPDDEDDRGLDGQGFIAFAEIEDFESLRPILNLEKIDLTAQLGNSLAFSDIPVVNENELVVIQDVTILDVPEDFSLINAIQRSLGIQETLAPSVVASASAAGVPEPASVLLLSAATAVFGLSRRRR